MSLYKGNQLIAGCVPDMANQSLSNLNSAGTKVIDGQWVNLNRTTIANEVSPTGTTDLSYVLSDVPDDGYEYEVLISGIAQTTATSGSACHIYIYSDKISGGLCLCRTIARSAAVVYGGGNAILPLTTSRKIYLFRSSGYTGSITLYLHGYRRIGTNS